MKIALYGRFPDTPVSENALKILFGKLKSVKAKVLIFKPFYEKYSNKFELEGSFESHQDLVGKIDFLFSIGGDGSLLETITFVRDSGIPIMGINTGRLGFLSSISPEEIDETIDQLIQKKYDLDKRTLLELHSEQKLFSDFQVAMNEITVQKADFSSMITVKASVNGVFLNNYWADGLILSTATGSTAYSLSCGGPVVMPGLDNFLISPISPHNLNVRPILLSSDDEITLEVEGRNEKFLVSIDSRSTTIPVNTRLTIRKAPFRISLVKLPGHDFFSTLRNKMMWGMDKRNH